MACRCAYWSFVAAFAHAGLHIRVSKRMDPQRLWAMRVVLAVVSCYGVYSFVRLGMPAYLAGQVQFAMADFGRPRAVTFARYASVAVLTGGVAHVAQQRMLSVDENARRQNSYNRQTPRTGQKSRASFACRDWGILLPQTTGTQGVVTRLRLMQGELPSAQFP